METRVLGGLQINKQHIRLKHTNGLANLDMDLTILVVNIRFYASSAK
jgi:hypothetical protein